MKRALTVAIVCGVSGAGKTTCSRKLKFRLPLLRVMELDRMLKALYLELGVGTEPDDKYNYGHWGSFLEDSENVTRAVAGFRAFLRRSILARFGHSGRLVVLGNHFVIESVERAVLCALEQESNVLRVQRFFLDVGPSRLLDNRLRRQRKWRVMGLDEHGKNTDFNYQRAIYMVNRFRTEFASRNYQAVTPENYVHDMTDYFRDS